MRRFGRRGGPGFGYDDDDDNGGGYGDDDDGDYGMGDDDDDGDGGDYLFARHFAAARSLQRNPGRSGVGHGMAGKTAVHNHVVHSHLMPNNKVGGVGKRDSFALGQRRRRSDVHSCNIHPLAQETNILLVCTASLL